jgi:hypothetical protein
MRTRRNIQGVIVLSTIESSEIAAPRRGSNPAPIHFGLNGPSAARRDFRPTGRRPSPSS